MPNVLLVGDSVRSTELRHEVSVAIGDLFRYVELDGRRIAIVWSVEGDRITAADPTVRSSRPRRSRTTTSCATASTTTSWPRR